MDIWQFNLRHLRAMAEIVRLGSISAASETVALTQPAITQAMHRLETIVGVPLFDRHSDGMTATPAALVFAPRINAALDHIASPRVTMAQVRALIALARAGSYAGASAATGLSQPSLHRAVQDLSMALRRSLAERRGRGVMLTESGQRTVRSFRLARAELRTGLMEIAQAQGREVGRIAIGAMPLSRAQILPQAVGRFHAAHPEVQLTIAEGSFAELIDPLRDGDLDILIGALRDSISGDDVVQIPLFDDHPVVFGRVGHPLAGGRADWAAMAHYPWIMPDQDTPLRQQWARMFVAQGLGLPRVPIECGSVLMIRQMLRESDFLTLLSPSQLALETDAGVVTIIADAPADIHRTIGITTRAGWRPTSLQRRFVETLGATL